MLYYVCEFLLNAKIMLLSFMPRCRYCLCFKSACLHFYFSVWHSSAGCIFLLHSSCFSFSVLFLMCFLCYLYVVLSFGLVYHWFLCLPIFLWVICYLMLTGIGRRTRPLNGVWCFGRNQCQFGAWFLSLFEVLWWLCVFSAYLRRQSHSKDLSIIRFVESCPTVPYL